MEEGGSKLGQVSDCEKIAEKGEKGKEGKRGGGKH